MNDFDRLASVYDLDMGTKSDDIPMYVRHAEDVDHLAVLMLLDQGVDRGRVVPFLAPLI